ncbi:uncharacterized protein LOC106022221 [Mesocricetus auratus]|uniref:Uncharacterized protein LOC106022221 n=1 Tax=Mesocricetus auratus TaxID=10036 RepID=A0ABM2WUW7_MESAU|nr:uncharacterized protein LOC106022221 [Mesocricetus auratus]
MTAPIAPAQGSNVRDSPGVETSPRGWHTIFLPPVPKKVRPLLPRPCLYLLLPPQRTDTCLAAAFFFPCWVAGGGHTTTTTLAKGRICLGFQSSYPEGLLLPPPPTPPRRRRLRRVDKHTGQGGAAGQFRAPSKSPIITTTPTLLMGWGNRTEPAEWHLLWLHLRVPSYAPAFPYSTAPPRASEELEGASSHILSRLRRPSPPQPPVSASLPRSLPKSPHPCVHHARRLPGVAGRRSVFRHRPVENWRTMDPLSRKMRIHTEAEFCMVFQGILKRLKCHDRQLQTSTGACGSEI